MKMFSTLFFFIEVVFKVLFSIVLWWHHFVCKFDRGSSVNSMIDRLLIMQYIWVTGDRY